MGEKRGCHRSGVEWQCVGRSAQELVNLLNSEQQAEQLQAQMQAQMIPLIIRGAGEHAQELAQHRDVLEAWVSRYLS